MRFYFSGIADQSVYQMLEAAQVAHILVDHVDAANVPPARRIGILDSGAFRLFRQGREIDMSSYLRSVAQLADRADLIVALDVVGDFAQTYTNWLAVNDAGLLKDRLIPVWNLDAPEAHLENYLASSRVVGIGGLAKIMREDENQEQKNLRDRTLEKLLSLCETYPNRFHIFGLNYLKAIEQLRDVCCSVDTSVFLRGARYGFVIFKHTKNGHLTQAPARSIPEYRKLDRTARCVLNAANIEGFLAS